MTYDQVVVAIIGFTVTGLFALALILKPEEFVRLQGRFYRRWYKDHLKMTDETLDRFPQLPWDRWMGGARSHFIANAESTPQMFPRLLAAHRRTGYAILAMVILTLSLAIWATATGKAVTGK